MVCRKWSERTYVLVESSNTESDFSYFEDNNNGIDCYFSDSSSDGDEYENDAIRIQKGKKIKYF